ncbi:hypothetical protein AB0I77_07085 [Streptomyces sp. NPDC050619]|uniref:hypothetical protein n=1 Tax=Streptomyces sp. NPDC050619 TaxID=3157214 RepID=UPI00343CF0DB
MLSGWEPVERARDLAVAEQVKAGPGGRAQGGTRLLGVITASHLPHELLGASGALTAP